MRQGDLKHQEPQPGTAAQAGADKAPPGKAPITWTDKCNASPVLAAQRKATRQVNNSPAAAVRRNVAEMADTGARGAAQRQRVGRAFGLRRPSVSASAAPIQLKLIDHGEQVKSPEAFRALLISLLTNSDKSEIYAIYEELNTKDDDNRTHLDNDLRLQLRRIISTVNNFLSSLQIPAPLVAAWLASNPPMQNLKADTLHLREFEQALYRQASTNAPSESAPPPVPGPTDSPGKSSPAVPRLDLSGFSGSKASTAFLNELRPKTDTSGWSKGEGHDPIKDAHHKIGKNVLAWVYEHMTPEDQLTLKKKLHLDWDSQALALTRLGSNLISPLMPPASVSEPTPEKAVSGQRTDDPMNNQSATLPNEEFMDLVKQSDGSLTPRSKIYAHLADDVIRAVDRRLREFVGEGNKSEDFRLDGSESAAVIDHLREAEILNFKHEQEIGVASHSRSKDAFAKASDRYTKRRVDPLSGGISKQDEEAYDKAAAAELGRKLGKKKQARAEKRSQPPSFREWLNVQDDVSEDVYEMQDRYEEWLENEFGE